VVEGTAAAAGASGVIAAERKGAAARREALATAMWVIIGPRAPTEARLRRRQGQQPSRIGDGKDERLDEMLVVLGGEPPLLPMLAIVDLCLN
jgi:hypothetical protein